MNEIQQLRKFDPETGQDKDIFPKVKEGSLPDSIPLLTDSSADLKIIDESGKAIVVFKDGEIRTKNFNSSENIPLKNDSAIFDLAFRDESGNYVFIIRNGHLKTKNFDSKSVIDAISDLDNLSPLKGLKYAALGDSITWGYTPHSLPGEGSKLKSYAKLTAEALGMNYLDYGISGNCLAGSSNPMCVRYASMSDDADIITFMGGTNDIRNGISLGQFSDRTQSTYYGALHVLIQGLIYKYKGAYSTGSGLGFRKTIIALTPIKMLGTPAQQSYSEGLLYDNQQAWVDAVKEVAAFYSIPCFDMYRESGICPQLADDYYATNYSKTGYFNNFIPDGIHVSQNGAKMMANQLINFIQNLIKIK